MYDVIIIGGGPAGLTAGIYACRAGLKTLLIEKFIPGGQAATTGSVDNYPGFEEGISGMDLTMKMEAQAARFGMETVLEKVERLDLEGNVKRIFTPKHEYEAKTVILAMGGTHKKLGAPGEERLMSKGVSYCATCDGALFRGKRVAVVGGGNVAVEDALDLSRLAEQVYLIHRRDALRADKILQDELMKNTRIEKLFDTVVEEICGDERVESLKLKNVKTGELSDLAVDGVFIAVGQEADSGIVRGLLDLDERGFIITDEAMATSVAGVFAAGDIRSKHLKQVITAAADGAVAAVSASNAIKKQ